MDSLVDYMAASCQAQRDNVAYDFQLLAHKHLVALVLFDTMAHIFHALASPFHLDTLDSAHCNRMLGNSIPVLNFVNNNQTLFAAHLVDLVSVVHKNQLGFDADLSWHYANSFLYTTFPHYLLPFAVVFRPIHSVHCSHFDCDFFGFWSCSYYYHRCLSSCSVLVNKSTDMQVFLVDCLMEIGNSTNLCTIRDQATLILHKWRRNQTQNRPSFHFYVCSMMRRVCDAAANIRCLYSLIWTLRTDRDDTVWCIQCVLRLTDANLKTESNAFHLIFQCKQRMYFQTILSIWYDIYAIRDRNRLNAPNIHYQPTNNENVFDSFFFLDSNFFIR